MYSFGHFFFYLAYFLTFYLSYLLTYHVPIYLEYLLTFYLAYLRAFHPAFCLSYFLAYLRKFYLPYLLTFFSNISSDILFVNVFGINSHILSGISADILCGISCDILSGIPSDILCRLFFEILIRKCRTTPSSQTPTCPRSQIAQRRAVFFPHIIQNLFPKQMFGIFFSSSLPYLLIVSTSSWVTFVIKGIA